MTIFFRLIAIPLLSIIIVSCGGKNASNASKKPNIILIFADDQCYKTLSAYGNDEVTTPALDKIAERGVTFTHAYNMGSWSGAVCLASRAMFNSGQFVWRAEQAQANFNQMASDGKMWGNLMQSAGYRTYMTGKWHVKIGADKCFDTVVHVRPGMPKDAWDHETMVDLFANEVANGEKTADEVMPVGYARPKDKNDTTWKPYNKKFGGYWKGGTHWSEVLKQDAQGFIKDATGHEEPFFMYLAFNAPHDPRQSPKEFVDMYPLENISIPPSFVPEHPNKEAIGNGSDLRDEALAPFPRTEYAVKVNRQEYYAIITHMDYQIQQILDALEASGEADNTYIFFTADHGLAVGHHGLIGKQNLYDHSIRPPLMVYGPDLPKNIKVDADVYLQDIMATALELAGVKKPEHVEFNSFLDLAKGENEKSHYDAIYGAYLNVQRMIRKDGYKLIVYPKIPQMLLFDMTNDPEEMHNLVEDEEHKAKVKELFDDLLTLQADMDDKLDISHLYSEIYQ